MGFLRHPIVANESNVLERKMTKAAWFWYPALSLLVVAVFKNYKFYKAGLLNPNFEIIHAHVPPLDPNAVKIVTTMKR